MEINIQEILDKHEIPQVAHNKFKLAIKEIITEVLKEASNSATLNHLYFNREDDYEKYDEYKNEGFLRTDGDGIPYAVDVIELNKKSITSVINKVKF